MTKPATTAQPFDATAFTTALDAWLEKKDNRQKLATAIEPALRDARRARHAFKVRPEKLGEAVTF